MKISVFPMADLGFPEDGAPTSYLAIFLPENCMEMKVDPPLVSQNLVIEKFPSEMRVVKF